MSRAEQARGLLDDLLSTSNNALETVSAGVLSGVAPSASERGKPAGPVPKEVFYRDLDDVWDHLLEGAKRTSPVPLTRLSSTEAEALVERLENEGFFMVKDSINVLAREIGKGRYTIYGYLRRIRAKKPNDTRPLRNTIRMRSS